VSAFPSADVFGTSPPPALYVPTRQRPRPSLPERAGCARRSEDGGPLRASRCASELRVDLCCGLVGRCTSTTQKAWGDRDLRRRSAHLPYSLVLRRGGGDRKFCAAKDDGERGRGAMGRIFELPYFIFHDPVRVLAFFFGSRSRTRRSTR
jgi:hypothetical protein